ncbi:MAG: LmeA family phospholipid-binding protein [Fimbriimonas sp.]
MNPLLFFIAGLFLVGGNEVRAFENHAAAEIGSKLGGDGKRVEVRSKLGPEALFGDVYAVTIKASNFTAEGLPLYTEPNRSQRGILRTLNLDLTDFILRDLHVQSLKAAIPDCRFDLGLALGKREIRLSRSGEGPGEVVLSADDLEKFIPIKFHEVKRVKVRLDKDKVFVDGYGEFVLFDAEFSLVARVEALEGNKLILAHARILIDGKPADPAAATVLLDTLNPVIDLDKDLLLYGAISVQKIRVADGRLVAECRTRIPVKTNP